MMRKVDQMKKCKMYTDGGCKPNPGFGGWAAIIIQSSKVSRISGHEANTTNNRMELQAVISGLETLLAQSKQLNAKIGVCVHSDSAYVVQGVNHENRLAKWKVNGYFTSNGSKIKNVELWMRLAELIEYPDLKVTFVKVKGHSDCKWNNECDELASLEIQLNRSY